MKAYLLDKSHNQIAENFVIDNDADFNVVELIATDCEQKCCIKWDRSTDGQAGYWSPNGAVFEPHWY